MFRHFTTLCLKGLNTCNENMKNLFLRKAPLLLLFFYKNTEVDIFRGLNLIKMKSQSEAPCLLSVRHAHFLVRYDAADTYLLEL